MGEGKKGKGEMGTHQKAGRYLERWGCHSETWKDGAREGTLLGEISAEVGDKKMVGRGQTGT